MRYDATKQYFQFRHQSTTFSYFYGTPWWRHQMETFSALLALCAGNSPVSGEFPEQRPVTRSFDVFFICAWINVWVNNREAGDLRRYRAQYDVSVMRHEISKSPLLNRCVAHHPQLLDTKGQLTWINVNGSMYE